MCARRRCKCGHGCGSRHSHPCKALAFTSSWTRMQGGFRRARAAPASQELAWLRWQAGRCQRERSLTALGVGMCSRANLRLPAPESSESGSGATGVWYTGLSIARLLGMLSHLGDASQVFADTGAVSRQGHQRQAAPWCWSQPLPRLRRQTPRRRAERLSHHPAALEATRSPAGGEQFQVRKVSSLSATLFPFGTRVGVFRSSICSSVTAISLRGVARLGFAARRSEAPR